MKIGRRIYYDVSTGDVLVNTGERQCAVIQTTIEQDINNYNALFERARNSFGVVELEFGQYAQDFAESNGYRVNPQTKILEFSYPDPNEEEPQEPIYRPPLSVEIEELKKENTLLKAQSLANSDRTDFHEEVITEIILSMYS